MSLSSPLLIIVALLCLHIVNSNARHLCISVTEECDSVDEIMRASCNNEDTDDIMIPTFNSGSGNGSQSLYCYTLEVALIKMQSNDTLLLSPGTHVLNDKSATMISNLSEISIIGDLSNQDNVVITCAKGVGLSFVNISGLILSGFTIDGCSISGSNAMVLDRSSDLISYSTIFDFSAALFLCTALILKLRM